MPYTLYPKPYAPYPMPYTIYPKHYTWLPYHTYRLYTSCAEPRPFSIQVMRNVEILQFHRICGTHTNPRILIAFPVGEGRWVQCAVAERSSTDGPCGMPPGLRSCGLSCHPCRDFINGGENGSFHGRPASLDQEFPRNSPRNALCVPNPSFI